MPHSDPFAWLSTPVALPLRSKRVVQWTFLVTTVLLLALIIALAKLGGSVIHANHEVIAAQKMADEYLAVRLLITDSETGQRGFVITGNPTYLQPYELALASMPAKFLQLKQAASPSSAADIARLERLCYEKLAEIKAVISLRRGSGFEAAATMVNSDVGMKKMDQIRGLLTRLREVELGRISQLSELSDRYTRWRTAGFVVAAILMMTCLLGAYLKVLEEIRAREHTTHEIANQREMSRVTLASIGDAVIVTDAQGLVRYMNHVALDLTKWSQQESLGKPHQEVFHILNEGDRDQRLSPVDEVIRTGNRVGLSNHTVLVQRDGNEIPIDDSAAPILNEHGDLLGVVLVFRDFTEHYESRRRLITAKQEAEAANIAKDNFLASLSHELRTPLTPVVATLASWEADPQVPQAMIADVQLMRRSIDLEARLIDDLLDLNRIVRGKLTLNAEITDVHELIDSTAALYQSEIHGNQLMLVKKLAATKYFVNCDPARMQQVIWNILRNAAKFTPEGGRIEIDTYNPTPDSIVLRFRDTGIGMSEETLRRIFEPFQQGTDRIGRRFGGLGLGMAISKALITAQNGEIDAYSEGEGKGSTFELRMPAIDLPARYRERLTPAESRSHSQPHSAKILFVEDHVDTANVMSRLLTLQGHQVAMAHTVQEALLQLERDTFDIMVSDQGLPDGTGNDLVAKMRELYGERMPAIALTGFGMEEDIARSKVAGFDEHLTKPVNIQRLEMMIQQLVGRSQRQPTSG